MIFKIRASGAASIMTEPKEKKNEFSKTCLSYLKYQWIQDNFNREKDLSTPAIQKGLLNEEQGITMLSLHLGDMLIKNELQKEDEHLKGTADLIHEKVSDIKCSFDIFTFGNAELTKDYENQLQVYMELWNLESASLVYVLTDTPDALIHGEVRSILYKLNETSYYGEPRYDEIFDGLKKQRSYSDVPDKMRIKTFEVKRNREFISALRTRVEKCREVYNTLSL